MLVSLRFVEEEETTLKQGHCVRQKYTSVRGLPELGGSLVEYWGRLLVEESLFDVEGEWHLVMDEIYGPSLWEEGYRRDNTPC
jgi:hypothetical protein